MAFDDMYFPPEKKRKRELEFEHLEQKGMSVAEYLAKLICLERFAPGLVANEKTRADRFFEGLIYPIKQRLATVKYNILDEVVSAASRDERIYQNRDKTDGTLRFVGKKYKNQKQMDHEEKKPKNESNIAMRVIQGHCNGLVCATCMREHFGECQLD